LVLTRAKNVLQNIDGVTVSDPDQLGQVLTQITQEAACTPIDPSAFLADDAYAPLPSLIQAARALFARRPLVQIWRARAATDPAVACIADIVHEAARTLTRHLVLLTGVPGAGKTLVGLRLVHADFLDDVAGVVHTDSQRRRISPAVFLSGNGPLVQVLQHALREAGGGGRVFVQGVKNYVKTYSRKKQAIPPEHVLVFDEAQRAWDAQHVALKHAYGHAEDIARSEPEHFIEFAERIPDWCVVVGLIGTGQEIHVGEEGGLQQWQHALTQVQEPDRWQVHLPPALSPIFTTLASSASSASSSSCQIQTRQEPSLNLDTEMRYHLTPKVHAFVEAVVSSEREAEAMAQTVTTADELFHSGHRYLLTRDLAAAKAYARTRYANASEARYGLLASSKDRDLLQHGVDNTFRTTQRLHVGRWYNQLASVPDSCCALTHVATEFAAQGLELDLAILAWGTDYVRRNGEWSIERARGYRQTVHDPFRLRQNVYRVLLTRGRDGTVIYVPPDAFLDETWTYLQQLGMRRLD